MFQASKSSFSQESRQESGSLSLPLEESHDEGHEAEDWYKHVDEREDSDRLDEFLESSATLETIAQIAEPAQLGGIYAWPSRVRSNTSFTVHEFNIGSM